MASQIVRGIPEVIANLKKYQIIKTEAIKDRLKKQAFKIELAAKEVVVVDTGRLRASISTNWAGSSLSEGKTGSQAMSGDGIKKPDGAKDLVYAVGTNVKIWSRDRAWNVKKGQLRRNLFPLILCMRGRQY